MANLKEVQKVFSHYKRTPSQAFEQQFRSFIEQIYRHGLGKYLLSMMAKFKKTCYYENVPGAFNVDKFRNVGGEPRLYLDFRHLKKDFEPTIDAVRRANKTFIYLFHELCHCYHVFCGNANLGSPVAEWKVTGLFEYENSLLFTENAFRFDLNLPRRPVYALKNPKFVAVETAKRKSFGLPPSPKDYLKGTEDNFRKWEQWKAARKTKRP